MAFPVLLLGSALAFASGSMEFLSIGDWGAAPAKKLAPVMGKFSPEFLIALGDNFYDDGVTGWDDPQFKDKFEDTFTAPSLSVPWYVCSGNHDYYGGTKGIQGEIQYTNHSKRWTFPSMYHEYKRTAADGTVVHFAAIDTWRINGGDTFVAYDRFTGEGTLKNKSHLIHSHEIGETDDNKYEKLLREFDNDLEIQVWDDQPQLDWITKTFAEPSDWRVAYGHFPIYSSTTGEHGDTKYLIKILLPILKAAKVDVYFFGHDHILQHIYKDGIHFFGSGAGARTHSGVNKKYKGLLGYHQGDLGFMVHNVSKNAFGTVFVTENNNKPYNYTITKPSALL